MSLTQEAETTLLDVTLPRTLDTLVERFSLPTHRGDRVEAWLFEDTQARRAAEARLAAAGVRARLRSAYKPLVCFFREEAPAEPRAVTVRLPAHAAAPAQRFLLEAYPLAALLGDANLRFEPGDEPLDHVVRIETEAGASEHRVFAPNRVRPDHVGTLTLTPCGWLRHWRADGSLAGDGALETEYEQVFARVMSAVAAQAWPATTPNFDVLGIDATLPGIEQTLPYGEEVMSTGEALHEDFYFSILELMKQRAGLPAADRTLQPGQIVPDIRTADGPARVRVALRAGDTEANFAGAPEVQGLAGLDRADRPLSPAQIAEALEALGGAAHSFISYRSRPIHARVFPGDGAAVVITSGQHANETSGVIGALRAAAELRAQGVRFAVAPCDNPDGYALHHRLRAANPRHMHHAARYTALGDDLESREHPPFYEKEARLTLVRMLGAGLHINLHGYPAHEWTRPLTGYLPRGFELWTIPKGFFLILRHHPGLADRARTFLDALSARLAEDASLRTFNARQLAVWQAHAGAVPFPMLNGIPCMITEHARQPTTFQLITEFPDETIYGDAFRLAHTTQMRATLAAVALWRGMAS